MSPCGCKQREGPQQGVCSGRGASVSMQDSTAECKWLVGSSLLRTVVMKVGVHGICCFRFKDEGVKVVVALRSAFISALYTCHATPCKMCQAQTV